MPQRHPLNNNLTLHYDNEWHEMPVYVQRGPLIVEYLESIDRTMIYAVKEFPRTSAMRFDLRIPTNWQMPDSAVISRFFASLKAQIEADIVRKSRNGKRAHPCRLRYVWAKESAIDGNDHYHVCVFLNRDAYFTLGTFKSGALALGNGMESPRQSNVPTNMSDRINSAWASALGLPPESVIGLVHYCDNGVYSLQSGSTYFRGQFEELFYRLSYLAKADTKTYGDNCNSFGCSRI